MKDKNSLTTEKLAIEQTLCQFLWKVYRRLGIGVAGLLKNTSLTPNQLTWFSFLLGLISSYFFFFQPHYFGFVTGSIFLLLSVIFDFVDGSFARMKGQVSHYGWYLDQTLDDIKQLLFILSLSCGLYRLTGDYRVWVCAILIFASDYFGDLAMTRFKTVCFGEAKINTEKFRSIIGQRNPFYRVGKNIAPVLLWRTSVVVAFALIDQMLLFFIIFSIWGAIVSLSLILFVGVKIKQVERKEELL